VAFNETPAIDALVAEGRWAEAAAAALEAGDPVRAAALFERIWEFGAAARAARTAGDLPRALALAIEARDEALGRELADALVADGPGGARVALEVYRKKRRPAEAAELAERLGERAEAAELYRVAHRELDAARLYAALGRDREAGLLYERVIGLSEGAERAHAHLRLGELLARRLQHEPAIRHLQAALDDAAELGAEIRPLLAVELFALGLEDAAREVLGRARADDPSLPTAIEDLVRARRIALGPRAAASELVAGRYRLDRLIGSGGSGRVHRAFDEVSGKELALKLLAATAAQGSPAWERFAREAAIAASLRHPNLVEVHDVSTAHGYLAMELMSGGSLESRLAERALPPAQVRRMALELLAGLELAHQRGVIHRDVKPANVFFDARGNAKLGDFGVAHLLDLGQTQTGGLIGTLAYMSPEQVTGAPLTVAADLYSIGVTLFEALAGRPPFLGPDFVAQHLGDPAPDLATLVPEAAAWAPILARLLAKDPDARYATAGEVARAIAQLEAGQPTTLVLPRARARPESLAAVGAAAPSDEAPRYQADGPLADTPISSLSRAVDRTLARAVVIERFADELDPASERRLLALARAVSPFFQRVLSFDRAGRLAVFEAPAGSPLDAPEVRAPAPRALIRLLKRLGRALAVLHDGGAAHGALGAGTILIDDLGNPSILAAGLGAVAPDASPALDCRAAIAAVVALASGDAAGGVAGRAASIEALIEALAPGLSPSARAAILALPGPRHGEELYAVADALELAYLRAAAR
jgi:serine/threonine-protein kinase